MVIHKKTRLTPIQREQVYRKYHDENIRVSDLAIEYHVSRPTIYKIIHRGKVNDFSVHKSVNKRFRCIKYGIKRLAKIEAKIEAKLKRQAQRYNKDYPGQMMHFDVKRLPLLKGDEAFKRREYLFVGIDDFSRELYTAIMPDKTQYSAKRFMEQILEECPYSIETAYSDNGKEFRGEESKHAFMQICKEQSINQKFTQVRRPQTNGKAERVIRTLMEMWHEKNIFKSSAHRKNELIRFVNYYNSVKPHKGISGLTPMEKLIEYFFPDSVNNA